MSVTTVDHNDDLHRLLESLNDLPSIRQPLGLIHDSEGPWHQIIPASTRKIKVKVKLLVTGLDDTTYQRGGWSVDLTFNDSLCDLLKINEQNFWQFTHVSGRGLGVIPFNWDPTGRPYSEIKFKIDKWGSSMLLSPIGDKVTVGLCTNLNFNSLTI